MHFEEQGKFLFLLGFKSLAISAQGGKGQRLPLHPGACQPRRLLPHIQVCRTGGRSSTYSGPGAMQLLDPRSNCSCLSQQHTQTLHPLEQAATIHTEAH